MRFRGYSTGTKESTPSEPKDRIWRGMHGFTRKCSSYSYEVVGLGEPLSSGKEFRAYTNTVETAREAQEYHDIFAKRDFDPRVTLRRKTVFGTRSFVLTPEDMSTLSKGIDPHNFLAVRKLNGRVAYLNNIPVQVQTDKQVPAERETVRKQA